jgi:hypothetical protein
MLNPRAHLVGKILELVQLKRVLWMLLMLIVIAPLGLASDFRQDLASSTESSLGMVLNGNHQSDIATDYPSAIEWDHLISATIDPQDRDLMKYSQSDMNELFMAINCAPEDFELTQKSESQNYIPLRDRRSSDYVDSFNYDQNVRIANTGLESGSNRDYLYAEGKRGYALKTKVNDLKRDIGFNLNNICTEVDSVNDVRIADHGISTVEKPNYYSYRYYKYEKSLKKSTSSPIFNAAYDINSNLNYIYKINPGSENNKLLNREIESNDAELSSIINQRNDPFSSTSSNLRHIHDSTTAIKPQGSDMLSIETWTNANLEPILRNYNDAASIPRLTPIDRINLQLIENTSLLDKKCHKINNYAIVVGINNYSDRSSLHTSINDAETMAALLESYGYEVVKLTDNTNKKPTKSNILEKALGEMKYKKDLGKVLIYFSGHGEKKGNNYYLIPQDGNGHISSYISTQELEESIKGLKSVALVVDACSSGELENVVGDGQMILVSSKEDQPSNEIWFGSLSLFTYNLCKAMREEDKSSSSVILERCFYKAREATERWSNRRLLAQTPQMKDKTSGYFSLN